MPKSVIRYSRTLAAFVLFLCHLADLEDRYSVDFNYTHNLSEVVQPFIAAVSKDYESPLCKLLLVQLLEPVIDTRGSLFNSAQDGYLVFHFLALRHLNSDGGFPPPINTTQALAHLQWCFRLVMFNKVRSMLCLSPQRPYTEKYNRDDMDEIPIIKSILLSLQAGQATEMGTIHTLKGILRHHADNHPRPSLARWDDLTFTRLYCEGKQFSLDAFRAMNENLLDQGERAVGALMLEESMEDWFVMPEFIHDRESNNGGRYSFLIDSRNGFDYLGSAFARHMLSYFAVGYVNDKVQSRGIPEYLSRCRTLLGLLAAMMHTSCGGAPRAEEAIHTRILEGKEGGRNLFWIRGKVGWILQYNKSKGQKVSGEPVGLGKLLRTDPGYSRSHASSPKEPPVSCLFTWS
jgi:hypothetical protein